METQLEKAKTAERIARKTVLGMETQTNNEEAKAEAQEKERKHL